MHTPAQISLDDQGTTAILAQSGKTLRARLLTPAGAKFAVMDAIPLPNSPHPENQNKNPGIRKLSIQLKDVRSTRIAVELESAGIGEKPPERELVPLDKW